MRKLYNRAKNQVKRISDFSSREKVCFKVSGVIESLNDCPKRGYIFIKWKLIDSPSSRSAKSQVSGSRVRKKSPGSGTTPLMLVQENSVVWNHPFELNCEVLIDASTGYITDCYVKFSVIIEKSEGYSKLGFIHVNMIDFLEERSVVDGPGKSKKFLLESSSLNSTLKISFTVSQTCGSPFFKIQPRPGVSSRSSLNLGLRKQSIEQLEAASDLMQRIDSNLPIQQRAIFDHVSDIEKKEQEILMIKSQNDFKQRTMRSSSFVSRDESLSLSPVNKVFIERAMNASKCPIEKREDPCNSDASVLSVIDKIINTPIRE